MITRRDIIIALIAVSVTLCVVVARSQTAVMQSSVFDWNAISAKPTAVGSVRQFFRSPTATLDELECHVTTLNPGAQSHPPHKHPNEELVIVREGATVKGSLLPPDAFRLSSSTRGSTTCEQEDLTSRSD